MKTSLRGSVIVILACIGSPIVASTVINFDTYPGGAPVPNHTLITTQYSSLGVIFSAPTATAGAPSIFANGEPSSGPNGLAAVGPGGSGGIFPLAVDFTTLASTINVTLISVGCGTTTATAYASDLTTVLDTISLTHGPASGNGFGNHDPITLTMGAGSGIARVQFSIFQNGPVTDGYGIDDLVFDTVPAPGALPILGFGPLLLTRRKRNCHRA